MKKHRNTAKLQVGLIGCGHIAQAVHLNILSHLPCAELIALADTDPGRRVEAGRCVPQARIVADYHELLAMPHVEAVVICLPSGNHAEAAIAAFAASKHVYLEKPLATNLEDGRKVLEAWKHAQRIGMIGFNYRFHSLYQHLKQAIQAGKIGPLAGIQSIFTTPSQSFPGWKRSRHTGGGVLLDLASHHIDLVHFLCEDTVCEVWSTLHSQQSEDDTATLHMRLSSGLLVQSFFSMNTSAEDRVEVYGQSGKLSVDRHRSLRVEVTPSLQKFGRIERIRYLLQSTARRHTLATLFAPRREPSYHASLSHFVTAAQAKKQTQPDLQDGYRSLAVVVAAEASAHTGRTIALARADDENFAG